MPDASPTPEIEDIPAYLRRYLTREQREDAWVEHCAEEGIVPGEPRAPARELEKPAELTLEERQEGMRAEAKRQATEQRIAKLKASLDRKTRDASGVSASMPLTGKDALRAIRRRK